MTEDCGIHIGVWSDGEYTHLFEPFPGATHFYCVSVPIGWTFTVEGRFPPEWEPSRQEGVVLRNTYGKIANANDVRLRAEHGEWGFKLVARWPEE